MRGFQRAVRRVIAATVGVLSACVHMDPREEPPVCVTVPFEPPELPPPAPPRLAPLAAEAPFLHLPVPGYLDAVVSLPIGATSPRPLLVAAHGAGDRPEWQCRFWREIVGDRAFVLCPRGIPESGTAGQAGFFYPSYVALGGEIEGATAALLTRFRAHVSPAAPVFAGFAQGAALGALLLPHHPARFSAAVLIEGGTGEQHEWTRASARRYRERGGKRVLLVCGCVECATAAGEAEGPLKKEGLAVQVVHVPGVGQTYTGEIGGEVARAFPWLVAGDERFGAAAR